MEFEGMDDCSANIVWNSPDMFELIVHIGDPGGSPNP
jgi:hypothetical protein